MSTRLGIDGKVYRNTGTYGTPTWTEITLVKDVQVSPTWSKADSSSRASKVMSDVKAQLALAFTISVKVSLTDAGYIALMDSFVDPDGVIDMLVLNGDTATNGVEGWRFDAGVFGASEDQSIGAALYRDFDIGPSGHAVNVSKRVTVAAGAPVFASIA